MNLQKIKKIYTDFSIIVVNTVLLFIIINLALGLIIMVRQKFVYQDKVGSLKYPPEKLAQVYPGKTPAEWQALLKETWGKFPWKYDPYMQSIEPERQGAYVNVSPNKYRLIPNQGPWPPQKENINIFVFGGSTVFGYGVSDSETIPAYLQQLAVTSTMKKPIKVYNFGQGGFYSSQERILFEELVAEKFIPDIVVFVDGLNDVYYDSSPIRPSSATELIQKLLTLNHQDHLVSLVRDLPITKALKKFIPNPADEETQKSRSERTVEESEKIIQRYVANKQFISAIADKLAIKALFVWQPVPYYKNNPEASIFNDREIPDAKFYQQTYEILSQLNQKTPLLDFVWLADSAQNEHQPIYVDEVHYTAAFNQKIASHILNELKIRKKL